MNYEELTLAEIATTERNHQDLNRRLPELINMANKVENVHATHAQCPKGLYMGLSLFFYELKNHIDEEETVLFPGNKARQLKPTSNVTINKLMIQHAQHEAQLEEFRKKANDFVPPEGACSTWRALYNGLEKLEQELMEQIHLENHILFPRFLQK